MLLEKPMEKIQHTQTIVNTATLCPPNIKISTNLTAANSSDKVFNSEIFTLGKRFIQKQGTFAIIHSGIHKSK